MAQSKTENALSHFCYGPTVTYEEIAGILAELPDRIACGFDKKIKLLEMLTIKKCTEAVRGISEHTVRKLAAQGRVRYIRTDEGERVENLFNSKRNIF